MLADAQLREIAQRVKTAQDRGLTLPQLTSQHASFDTASAYAVADLIRTMRLAEGANAVGRKIGFTNSAMWAKYGVTAPIWSTMYDSTVTYLDDQEEAATCSLSGFVNPKIEPEIIFHFHSAPPPGGDVDAVLACVDWVAHGFEMVQSHYADWLFQAPDAIADSGLHGRLLVGKPQALHLIAASPKDALAAFTLSLSEGDVLRETATGANVLGNPIYAVMCLMDALTSQSLFRPLQAGELITTGTVTSAYSVQSGQHWQTALAGIALPGLSVRLTD